MVVEKDIQQAFWQLLDIKPYSKISVNDIVHRCGIHRNTFYYHFESIPDLVKKITLDRIDNAVLARDKKPSTRLMPYFSPMVAPALADRDRILNIYRCVDHNTSSAFIKRMADYAVGRYFETAVFEPPLTPEDQRIMRHYGRSLFTGILMDWLDSGMEYDLVELIDRTNHLLFGGQDEAPLYRLVKDDEKKTIA